MVKGKRYDNHSGNHDYHIFGDKNEFKVITTNLKHEIIKKYEQGIRVIYLEMQYNFYNMYYTEAEGLNKSYNSSYRR